MAEPRAGERWRHFKGGLCNVLHAGRWEPTGEAAVVYQEPSGVVWIRPLSAWMEEVEPGVPRFSICEGHADHCAMLRDPLLWRCSCGYLS